MAKRVAKRTAKRTPRKNEVRIAVSGMELNRKQLEVINQIFATSVLAVLQHWNWSAKTEVQVEIGDPKIVSKT